MEATDSLIGFKELGTALLPALNACLGLTDQKNLKLKALFTAVNGLDKNCHNLNRPYERHAAKCSSVCPQRVVSEGTQLHQAENRPIQTLDLKSSYKLKARFG